MKNYINCIMIQSNGTALGKHDGSCWDTDWIVGTKEIHRRNEDVETTASVTNNENMNIQINCDLIQLLSSDTQLGLMVQTKQIFIKKSITS